MSNSSNKKRLSIVSGLHGLIMEADDDEEKTIGSNRKSFGRRRSSFGSRNGKSPLINPEKQQRLAKMYAHIIQMSTDNVSSLIYFSFATM